MSKKLDLVEIIRANPGCKAIVDNDCWSIYAANADLDSEDEAPEPLIESGDDFKPLGDGGYGSGNCYGGDILQALAVIVGMKIESV